MATSDGGFAVAGSTKLFGAGYSDGWVLKLDGEGNVLWQKTYGGSNPDSAAALITTSNDSFVIAGFTDYFGTDSNDAWVMKLDSTDNVLWQKTYDGSDDDRTYALVAMNDGGFAVAVRSGSFVAGSYEQCDTGDECWLVARLQCCSDHAVPPYSNVDSKDISAAY